ncbi:MAG: DNA polymerase I [Gemmatimonadetes bacterium]|nr:DNA polymerase I [Gemmatimonadota bacterium]
MPHPHAPGDTMVEVPPGTRPRLFLIDGYALIYRAYFALINRPLTTSRGENSSAAYGFTRFLKKLLEEHRPEYLGVVLDAGSSKRTERYPAYKATREKMPADLAWSLPRIREIIEGFRIPILEVPDHEADDVIGTLARQAAGAGLEAVIVSGDKDFYQLLGDHVCLLNPGRGGSAGVEEEWIDRRNASQRLGVAPEYVTDYLALIGDSSDNIPGAKGIGPKTALALIEEFGHVEDILARAAEVSNRRARESLLSGAAEIRLSKELVTIMADLPIRLEPEQLRVSEPDRERLTRVFLELEFGSLVREYATSAPEANGAVSAAAPAAAPGYALLDEPEALAPLLAEARAQGWAALRTVGGDGPLGGELLGVALALAPGRAWYLPLAHRRPGVLDLEGVQVRNLPPLASEALRPLRELLEDERVGKVGHDLKLDLLRLRAAGVGLRGLTCDVMLASYVLDPGGREHGLDALALQHLNRRTTSREELCGKGRVAAPLAECAPDRVLPFAAAQADAVLALRALCTDELDRFELLPLYRDIELPLVAVLAEMEWVGIRIDAPFFAQLGARLARELQQIQDEIWKVAGEPFNIGSTQQLRSILFEKLGLPALKKTKTGASTDAGVLEELAAQGHELPRLLLEWRQVDKLKGTYVDALPQLLNRRTGRIHTSFNQTVAAPGRLSSTDPNLQNIPIRTAQGAEIRRGFIPANGHVFLGADYSQIELRILAHFSGDAAFVQAFRNGQDIHRQTAAVIWGRPVEEVTPRMRADAKTVNFATIYGQGPFALAQQLGIPQAEARAFIDQYFERFPGVRRYLDEQIERARTSGYVETISGRRRYIPEINSRNYSIRQFGARAAPTAPVQGSAADIIKLAMIGIHRRLAAAGSGARMLLQVHDELLFEVPAAELAATRALVQDVMEHAFPLSVPLEVKIGAGESWYECK